MGEKKNVRKLTLEDLINRKMQGEIDKLKVKEIYSKELGGSLQFKKIRLTQVLRLMDELDGSEKASENMEFMVNLIYKCCDMLHNKELQEAYECVEPTDIVLAIFDDNMGEITEVAGQILKMYGIDIHEEVNKQIKN